MSGAGTRVKATKETELPVFVTAENRSKLMEIYDEALRHWPLPFETSFVATRYGKTHVIASGDPAAPPLVLLHPMGVGGFVWSSIIKVLSEQWRTYALDTIGDVGKSELADPDRYPKRGRDYSAWLDDVFAGLGITRANVVAGSMGGWIAMNHAIYRPDQLRRLVLLGPMGLAPWRATFSVLGPFLSQRFRPTAAKLEKIITRSLGEGEAVNRGFRPWMRIMGYTKARTGQPFHLSARKLRKITTPTLVFLGGKDGLVGDVAPAERRAQRYIAGCEVEVLPNAGHVMSVDEPEFVGKRIVEFLHDRPGAMHTSVIEQSEAAISSLPSPFKSSKGEARYLAAYDASMRLWPVPYESIDVTGRHGRTHVVVSGPLDAPALVLLHGDYLSLAMWSPNVADLSRNHRVYAVDVMGQPGRSVPDRHMKNRDDCVAWLSEVLDGLDLPKVTLIGMSFGGCLSLNFALRVPGRVDRLVLLSPGGSFSAVRPTFYLRVVPAMLIPFLPKRFFERVFWSSMLYQDNLRDPQTRAVNEHMLEQAYLGLRYFRRRLMWENYTQNQPLVLPDDELRSIEVQTLLLIGQQERAYDAAAALERARRLMPNLEGELIPRASHDMSVGQHDIVDKRILNFLKPIDQPG